MAEFVKTDLVEFTEGRNIRFELVAIDEDNNDVIAKIVSHIDADEVASKSEVVQAQVDEYLINEYFEADPMDYDDAVKYMEV